MEESGKVRNELERTEMFRTLLWEMSLVLNMAHYYRKPDSIDHPLIETKIRDWLKYLLSALQVYPEIVIEESGDTLIVNEVKFPTKSIVLKKLLQNLLKFRIGFIRIRQDLSYEEVKSLLFFLTITLEKIEDLSEGSQAFEQLKLSHLDLEFAEYKKVTEKEKISSRQNMAAPTGPVSTDQADIAVMVDFLRNFEGDQSKVPSTWVNNIIKDPHKFAQLMLMVAETEESKRELSLRGDWPEVITFFLLAIRNYLLGQIEKGKSPRETLKYLGIIEDVVEAKIAEKRLEHVAADRIRQSFAHTQKALTLDGVLADFRKEQGKLDKLATQLVSELDAIREDAQTFAALCQKLEADKRPAEALYTFIQRFSRDRT